MLFENETPRTMNKSSQPLGERVRPEKLNELVGQDHIWSLDSPLRRLVESDKFYSLIFWGPSGTGKTSLAKIIGKYLNRPLVYLSCVHAGVKEIRKELDKSKDRVLSGESASLLFMDEIHRLSKSQQDVLLPALEDGSIRFIGATTENPSFEVNSAINSRSLSFHFNSLSTEAIAKILKNATSHKDSEFDGISFDEDVLTLIARSSGGDARKALNLLEAVRATLQDKMHIQLADVEPLASTLQLRYDRSGEDHYQVISAMIKSIRGSHPDAAIYYLARMLAGGEDPRFIARRIVIAASEEIGNANPTALLIANAALEAVSKIGMPEARIILSQTVTYLASSPKSNKAYLAVDRALADIKTFGLLEIPKHLTNASTELMINNGYGKNYVYAHDDLAGAKMMTYLPTELKGRKYYEPTSFGAEKQLKDNLNYLRPTQD